jgi:predicted HAD superfamily Cof-like phosphohydrolase
VSSYYTDVVAWHRKFGVPVADHPVNLTPERMTLRCGLMHEEGREFWAELALPDQPDLAKVAKEAADVLVTVLGTMAELGIPFDAVWAEVMASNNSKADPDGTVYKRADGKVLKGSHYREADIASVLAAATTSGSAA